MVTSRLTAVILRAATDNGGYVCSGDARELGLDARILARLADSGVLTRLARGLYALPGVDTHHLGRQSVRLAHVAVHTGGAISHTSAARVYGFTQSSLTTDHLTVPSSVYRGVPTGIVLHRTAVFRPVDVRRHSGLLLTSPARTLVDLAGGRAALSDGGLVDLFDHLVSLRLLAARDLPDYIAGTAHLPGIPRTRRLFAHVIDGGKVESLAERRLVTLIGEAGLPVPTTQFVLRAREGGFVARLDIAWPDRTLAVEVDGYRYHSGTKAFRHDRERATLIQLQGWTLYRTTPAEIADGAPALIEALHRALLATGHN